MAIEFLKLKGGFELPDSGLHAAANRRSPPFIVPVGPGFAESLESGHFDLGNLEMS